MTYAPYWTVARRIYRRAKDHDCMGTAAQAAFGALMSLVPAFVFLIAFTSTIGVSEQTVQLVVSSLAVLLPAGSRAVVDATVRAALAHPAPGLLTTSLALTLWSATGMLATYTKGINRAYGCKPRYAYWRNRFISLVLVVVVAVPLGVASVATLLGRTLGRYASEFVREGPLEAIAWGTLRWSATFTLVVFVVALVYLIAPSDRSQPLDVLPGSVVATAGWAVLSIVFNQFTASQFAHYRIYGSLAAIVLFLFWMYLSSAAFLIGAELNAELQGIAGGPPVDGA